MTAFVRVLGAERQAEVDDWVLPVVSQYRWRVWKSASGIEYARATVDGARVFLHSFVAGLYGIRGQNIDHRNHDGLNNSSANLRGCTASDNATNRNFGGYGASGVRGVVRCKGRWAAKFRRNGVTHYIGLFDTAEEASRAVAGARLQFCGEFIPPAEVAALKSRLQELERAA